jgi:hypothetical protein
MEGILTALDTTNERDVDGLVAANDPLLRRLITTRSEEERRDALESVLTGQVVPLVRRIVQRHQGGDRLLRPQDAEDIASTVVVRLVRKLQRVPFEREEAIDHLADFAAVSTFNAINDFLRLHFPEHTRLKNQVRYALANDARFRTWSSPAGPACALASWPETEATGQPPAAWRCEQGSVADALESLLRAAAAPLLVSTVAGVLADVWNIAESRLGPESEPADEEPSQASRVESRQRLAALWRETCALPAGQRTALLLNLRDVDGGSAIALFTLMGVASLDEVASAIDLPLTRLAALWPRLPLDDLTIASLLGIKRQQVINLRLAARQRLARRLEKW